MQGNAFQIHAESPDNGGKLFYSFVPIVIDGVTTPWSIGLVIPEKTVLARSNAILKTSILISIVSIFLIVILFFLINGCKHFFYHCR